jgi:hypothetical protein
LLLYRDDSITKLGNLSGLISGNFIGFEGLADDLMDQFLFLRKFFRHDLPPVSVIKEVIITALLAPKKLFDFSRSVFLF